MSDREKEIFEIIKKNPSISQIEISKLLSISRSSVATHIRNITNKGYIIGRTYILNENTKNDILIIGGTNLDIQGISEKKLISHDSNPGRINFSAGGVGRNICENLSKIKDNISFITVLGDDTNSINIQESLKSRGVYLGDSIFLKNEKISIYLSILDNDKEMSLAIADMDNIENLTKMYLKKKFSKIKEAKILVLDTNLNQDSIDYLLTHFQNKIIVDLVSTTKAMKVKNNLSKIHTLKSNLLEAGVLLNKELKTKEDIVTAGDIFIKKGIKNVFITLGKDGVYYVNKESSGFIKNPPVNVLDVTGAGDSFTAGIAYATFKGYSIDKIAKYGISMSYINIQHLGTSYENLTEELLNNTYNRIWKGIK